MRALIWLGLRPRIDTSNAAVPATCGAAMLVPRAPTMKMGSAAQGLIFLTGWPSLSRLSAKTVWLHAAHTNTSLPAGGVRSEERRVGKERRAGARRQSRI